MKEPCDICNHFEWSKIRNDGNNKIIFLCDECVKNIGFTGIPYSRETTNVMGFNHSTKEIDEVYRHRMLPYDRPEGGYYAGRMGDNGKIAEKPISPH